MEFKFTDFYCTRFGGIFSSIGYKILLKYDYQMGDWRYIKLVAGGEQAESRQEGLELSKLDVLGKVWKSVN